MNLYEREVIDPLTLKYMDLYKLQGYGEIAILTEFCNDRFPSNYVLLSTKRKAKDLPNPAAADYPIS